MNNTDLCRDLPHRVSEAVARPIRGRPRRIQQNKEAGGGRNLAHLGDFRKRQKTVLQLVNSSGFATLAEREAI
jgi:hypothetical protein